MRLLVTGGAGYIGSHLVITLLEAGHEVVVVDDFSRGHPEALVRAQRLTGRTIQLFPGDVANKKLMARALEGVDVVLHLAAYKAVGDSMESPETYFLNNTGGTAALLESMERAGVRRIIYSSTAAVYGSKHEMPLQEDFPLAPESPYGQSKADGERMIDWMVRLKDWSSVVLRYFNPVGAHPSGRIGEPFAQATSLVPKTLKAAGEGGGPLVIFGTDYKTEDGTCLRDFVHVMDLAEAHLAALGTMEAGTNRIFNVGTGTPHSVREVLSTCRAVTGLEISAEEGARRPGDMAVAVADPSRFEAATGFLAGRSLDEMVASAWHWWRANPHGYDDFSARATDPGPRMKALQFPTADRLQSSG